MKELNLKEHKVALGAFLLIVCCLTYLWSMPDITGTYVHTENDSIVYTIGSDHITYYHDGYKMQDYSMTSSKNNHVPATIERVGRYRLTVLSAVKSGLVLDEVYFIKEGGEMYMEHDNRLDRYKRID